MASLLARVAPVHAHARLQCNHRMLPSPRASHPSAVGSLVWPRSHASIDSKHFTTSISSDTETSALVDTVKRSSESLVEEGSYVRRTLDAVVQKKIQYIQRLARRNAFDVMLRVVQTALRHAPSTQGVPCSLLAKYVDTEATAMEEKAWFAPSKFNESITRRLEIEIMTEFLSMGIRS